MESEEEAVRFTIRFCLLAVMPFVALLGTIWGIGVLPPRGVSAFAHVGPILAAEALWIACASLYLFMSHRNEDR